MTEAFKDLRGVTSSNVEYVDWQEGHGPRSPFGGPSAKITLGYRGPIDAKRLAETILKLVDHDN